MRVVFGGLIEEILAVCQMMLRGRSGGGERRLYTFGMGELERTIHLIGGDMIETLALVVVFPDILGGVQQVHRSHHVGEDELHGVGDGAVHMRLGGEVDNPIVALLLKQVGDEFRIHDVALHETVVRLLVNVGQVLEIACVGELVQIVYFNIGVLVDKKSDHMGTDEAGTAGNENFFHNLFRFLKWILRCQIILKSG